MEAGADINYTTKTGNTVAIEALLEGVSTSMCTHLNFPSQNLFLLDLSEHLLLLSFQLEVHTLMACFVIHLNYWLCLCHPLRTLTNIHFNSFVYSFSS